ncbi:MAG: phosphatase PAP2 family protein [Acidobacteriaceae bacterium]|nr:phosphatase PAP2 family protein [Acidobacteriaceae bacterium]
MTPHASSALRPSERLLLWYFIYAAVLPGVWKESPSPARGAFSVLAAVGVLLFLVARAEAYRPAIISRVRDFLPLGLTLAAFEEMTLFAPRTFAGRLEGGWIRWDHILLHDWHLRAAIESAGWLVPLYLEFCYLLVYGLGTYCVLLLYFKHKRSQIDHFFLVCLTGTLLAYALFPWFPSQPPRELFPTLDSPEVSTWARHLNLWILRRGTIHVAVFPSAHVSSAFAAAWAMFLLLPEQKRFGWGLLFYAISVSAATVYGRYHYTTDVLAGFAVSLAAATVALGLRRSQGSDRAAP